MLLIVLAVPVLAFLLYLSWRQLRQSAPAASLAAQVKMAGFQISGTQDEGSETRIESTQSLDSIEKRLRQAVPEATIDREGTRIIVRRPGDAARIIITPARADRSRSAPANIKKHPAESEQPKLLPTPAATAVERRSGSIVLILDDVGFDNQPIVDATQIPALLNFAVIPGTPNATRSATLAHENGHEILCHLPMEPLGYPRISPGAGAILTSMTGEDIRTLTEQDVRSIPFAQGVNNHMGSKATTDARVMNEMLSALPAGTYFIDSRTTSGTLGSSIAHSLKIRTASRDVFLDDTRDAQSIRRQLAQLAEISSRRGFAVGIGHMYPSTVRVLQQEVPKLQKMGFRFVHASEIVR
ncbi:MAG: divergent polysaccharide deacetylase family protein [Acidobacteriota bacterium]